ncbi:MAG TPA: glycosyltransferase family 9 protein [Ideonella sp.]|nr:glycosyltransferase family 9 protein [Ideonella sp.]
MAEHLRRLSLDAPPRRVLVVCMRRIGDVLLASALLRSVRRAWPQARVEVLVNAGSAAALQGNPDIDRLWVQPEHAGARATLALARQLWRRYDLAISALYNDRPHLWAFIASARRAGVVPPRGQSGARWKRWLCDAWCELELGQVHAVEQYLRLVDALGIARIGEVVPPRPDARAVAPLDAARPQAVLHPSPLYRYKAWTVAGWRDLARHLVARGFDVVLTGGPAEPERAVAREIVEGLDAGARAHTHNLVGTLPLAALTPLIEGAKVFVGPDTSVTHLAAATGTPTVALFGPSHPVAWGPWPVRWHPDDGGESLWRMKAPLQRRGNVWLVQGEGDCVPCLGEGCDKHPGSHSRCLDELTSARVIEVVERALAEAAQPPMAAVPARG